MVFILIDFVQYWLHKLPIGCLGIVSSQETSVHIYLYIYISSVKTMALVMIGPVQTDWWSNTHCHPANETWESSTIGQAVSHPDHTVMPSCSQLDHLAHGLIDSGVIGSTHLVHTYLCRCRHLYYTTANQWYDTVSWACTNNFSMSLAMLDCTEDLQQVENICGIRHHIHLNLMSCHGSWFIVMFFTDPFSYICSVCEGTNSVSHQVSQISPTIQ